MGRRSALLLPLVTLVTSACSRVPSEVDENDDVAKLEKQVELPFHPTRARWMIKKHASGGSIGILYAHLVALLEAPPAERAAIVATLRRQPQAASLMLGMEIGPMTGPLAELAKRPGGTWHVALPVIRGKKFPTTNISELMVWDDGIIAFLLASPSKDF